MKKVLLASPVAPWGLFGGTATVSRNLIELLSEMLAARVCCLRCDEAGTFPRTIHHATVLSGRVSEWRRKLKFFWDFSPDSFAHRQFDHALVRARFAALLAREQPECVIFDHIFSAWLVDLVPPEIRIAYIAHDDMVAYAESLLAMGPGPLPRLRFTRLLRQYRHLQGHVLRRCDFVLTMTREDATRLRPSTSAMVEVAPLFFDFQNGDRDYSSDFRYLLVNGSFDTWEKQLGLTQFLETVFTPLRRRCPELRAVIAGRIPPALQHQIQFSEPDVRIVHRPSDAEMRTLVQEASAGTVLDLQVSGLKIKTIDLAAAGLPLVSWVSGIEGSSLVPGESCLCAASPEEFASHLGRLCTDASLRRKLGTTARALTQAQFSKEAARARFHASALFSALAAPGVAAPAS
ncbi:MAG: glycosyltransferase [Chthoniobacter sp.]|nr:glycosyltransferase [Chthoniobacter sp.]